MLGECHWLPVVADGDWAPGHDYFSEARPLHGRKAMHPVVVSGGLGTACTWSMTSFPLGTKTSPSVECWADSA